MLFLPCAFAASAATAMRDFGDFSMAVPETWRIEQEGPSVVLLQPQQHCAISVAVAPHQGSLMRELAITFYQKLHGAAPIADDDGMTFTVTNHKDIQGTARFSYHEKNFALVTAYGTCKDMQDILSTLTLHEEGPRAYPLLTQVKRP